MESFYFTVFGLIFCVLLMIIYFPKKKVNYLENKIYSIIIIVTFFSCLAEVYSYILVQKGCDPYAFSYLLSLKILFLGFLSWVYFFTLYIIIVTISDENNLKKMHSIVKKSSILFIGLVLTILVLPITVTNVNGMLLPSGLAVNVLYACAAICILLMFGIYLKNIKNFKNKKYIPLYLLIFIFGIVVFIQNILPSLLLINAAFVLITFVMYFTIENPDVKMIEELNKNRKLVNQTMEEKSNFLFLAASQIRNPIEKIIDITKKTLEINDIHEVKVNVKQINNLVHSLAFQVENVMDISTLDTSNIKIVKNKYNFPNLINKIKLVKEKEISEGIEFRINMDSNIPNYLYGDSKLLEQVITSILNNAIKYTKVGFIELTINAIVKYDECRLLITIEDSGTGISIDKVNDLLTIDEALSKTELDRLETKDIDINTIKKIVNKMGGYFTIKSELERGTEVKIVIDQKIEMDTTTINFDKYDKQVKVLIASNDIKFIKDITRVIEKKEYSVENSIYGKDVLDRIRVGETFDLIFLDNMLDIRAFELLKELKKKPKFKTPVIVMLDESVEFIKDHFVKDGFTDYLLKSDLVNEVNRIFK